ncbi:MAG: alpha/beta fold hydrolase [Paludibacteraceae bacterium]|nr:alpha/beta fold hydrolase [Paludibacteraceae bacterium]
MPHTNRYALISSLTCCLMMLYASPRLAAQTGATPQAAYSTEEVRFVNTHEGISLSGTLTRPNGAEAAPAVVMITGSGPQNRDEEIAGHKPFAVIADLLARNGIASLRFDDRGVGGSEHGKTEQATTLDLSYDVEAAYDFVRACKGIDTTKIGLLGHSEGGQIAVMLAARRPDIACVVSMAGPAVRGDEMMTEQVRMILHTQGVTDEQAKQYVDTYRHMYDIVIGAPTRKAAVVQLSTYLQSLNMPQDAVTQYMSYTQPWFYYMLRYDPADDLRRLTCPAFFFYGSHDTQVSARQSYDAIHDLKQSNLHPHIFNNVNHLFQRCSTGSIDEYGMITEDISQEVLHEGLSLVLSTLRRHPS